MTTSSHIRLQQVKGIGAKRLQAILAKLDELGQTVDDLFKMSSVEIIERFQIPKNVAEAIVNAPDVVKAESQSDLLEKKGVRLLTSASESYPQKILNMLGKNAPTQLYIWGNLDLLNRPAVGFCGSRNVTNKGIEVTIDTAQQIVELGWVVVSGHARGVDVAAHRVALENGGSTIIVLAEGILDFKLRQELKKIAKPEQLLIVSEFAPTARWSIGNAMTRNKTIIGLSDAMVLVEARLEGGTFDAGKTALKLKAPLFVAQYGVSHKNVEGNEYFLKHGARRLQKSQKTSRANIEPLREIVLKRSLVDLKNDDMKTDDSEPKTLEQASMLELIPT